MEKLSKEDVDKGHAPCKCGEFTFVHSQALLSELPKDYFGEQCEQCGFFMCRLSKLKPCTNTNLVL